MPKQKKSSFDKRIVYMIVAMILIIIGLLIFKSYYIRHLPKTGPAVTPPTPSVIANVTYTCDDKKTIQAIYYPNQVVLTLSDGRNMTVPQAMSASGARYANQDESFVFWNKGDTAFIQEGQATTFSDCNENKELQPTKGDVTVKGELFCLPHKNKTGPQTMECAFGLKADGGVYYALSDKDPMYKNLSSVPMNKQVEITGSIKLNSDTKYDTIGTIFVTSIKQL